MHITKSLPSTRYMSCLTQLLSRFSSSAWALTTAARLTGPWRPSRRCPPTGHINIHNIEVTVKKKTCTINNGQKIPEFVDYVNAHTQEWLQTKRIHGDPHRDTLQSNDWDPKKKRNKEMLLHCWRFSGRGTANYSSEVMAARGHFLKSLLTNFYVQIRAI